VGVLLAALFFANKISHFRFVEVEKPSSAERLYTVHGQVFFNTADKLKAQFDFKEALDRVVIDVHQAHFWDISAVHALDMVVLKFIREGAEVEVVGLNQASATIVDRFGVHDKKEEIKKVLGEHSVVAGAE